MNPLGSGDFLLLADPPWDVKVQRPTRAPHQNFPRLSLERILSILQEREADAAVSLTFTLDKFLPEMMRRPSALPNQGLLIWDKKNPCLGWVVRKAHEPILLRWREGWKPDYPIPSILAYPRSDRRYATSKPVALMTVLLEAVGLPVVDLFPGGGSAQTAAKILGLGYQTSAWIPEVHAIQ